MDNEYRSRTNWFMGGDDLKLPAIVKEVGNVERYEDQFDCEDSCLMNEGRVTYIVFKSKAKTNPVVLKAMVEAGWERTTVKHLPFYYKYMNDLD